MPWKKKADGSFEVNGDGDPIWITESTNAETAVSGGTITRLNGEAMANRQKIEKLNEQIKAFEGLDPEAARTAIAKMKDIDLGKLVDSGKLDEVKKQISDSYSAQLKAAEEKAATIENKLNGTILTAAFRGSKFISEKLLIDADLTQKLFGDRFSVEGEKIVPKTGDGKPIYSKKVPGEFADFDEAFEEIFGSYSGKDALIKGANHSGTGNNGGGSNSHGGGGRTITRAQFNSLSLSEQAKTAKTPGINIVD